MTEHLSRITIGICVFIVALSVLKIGGILLSLVLFLILWQTNTEFLNIVQSKGINPSKKWIRFVSIVFILIASLPTIGFPAILPIRLFTFVFIFGVIGCFFRLVFRGSETSPIATIPDIGASVLGFVYTGLLPAFLILLRQFGFEYALIPIISTALCDIGAYYGGRFFGRHKLKPEISPKKTFEGSVAGFITSMIASILMVYFLKESFNGNIVHGVFIGIFTGIFSQFGDLFESLLKRDAGLKDSGTFLLSHGGILDRIDSYMFVVWAVYFYVSWIVLGQF